MTNSGFNFLSLLNVTLSFENASLIQNNVENVLALLKYISNFSFQRVFRGKLHPRLVALISPY